MIVALSAGRDAPLELRERVALHEADIRALLGSARPPGLTEVAVLSTCHRTEVYGVADGPEADAVHALAEVLPALRPADHQELRVLRGAETAEHLFRVAAGLDSLVLGEPQVLGQVRSAMVLAREVGAAGPVLMTVFGRAMRLGRRARAQTALGALAGSLGRLTADHLAERLGGLAGRPGVVVGAGEAAGDAVRELAGHGAELTVLSRSAASAERLAAVAAARAAPIEVLPQALRASEFAVVAVAGGPVLDTSVFPARAPEAPLLVIDLSVPHAVDVNGLAGIEVRRIDDLPAQRDTALSAAVTDAEALVRAEVAELGRWIESRGAGPAIRELRARAERMVRREVARTIGRLDLTPEEAERVAAMGMRIANKLLHAPTTALRDADGRTREAIAEAFDL